MNEVDPAKGAVDDSPAARRARLGRLTLLFVAHAVGTANITLVLAFAPVLQNELGVVPTQFGWAVAGYHAAQMVCALPAGWLVDRFGIRRVLMGSHVILACGMAVIAQARGLAGLVIGLVLCGFGYALINPATARGALAWFSARHRATAMSAKQTGVPIGAVALAMTATVVGDQWRMLALALTTLLLLTMLSYAKLGDQTASTAPSTMLRDLRQLLTHRTLNIINAGTCLYTTALSALLAYFVTFVYEVTQIPAASAGLFLAMVQGASAVGRLVWGVAGDRLPGNGRIAGLMLCGVMGGAGLAALPFAPSATALAFLAVALGFTVGGFSSLAQTLAVEAVEPRLAGAAVGYNMLLTTAGMMIGPALFALCLDLGDYRVSWQFTALCLFCGAILFVYSGKSSRPPFKSSGR
jgi:predicted MFS family arabinose efflux permease